VRSPVRQCAILSCRRRCPTVPPWRRPLNETDRLCWRTGGPTVWSCQHKRPPPPNVSVCARQERLGCAPVRDLIGIDDLDLAYESSNSGSRRARSRRRLIGRKIGLTSPAVQAQFGVHQPALWRVIRPMWMQQAERSTAWLSSRRVSRQRLPFTWPKNLDAREVSASDVVAASDWVAPAFEIVDSRIANWDITITDTIADNASAGLFCSRRRPNGRRPARLGWSRIGSCNRPP